MSWITLRMSLEMWGSYERCNTIEEHSDRWVLRTDVDQIHLIRELIDKPEMKIDNEGKNLFT